MHSTIILASISVGELVDKITILEIKKERIDDPAKLDNITGELDRLFETFRDYVSDTQSMRRLMNELKTVNLAIWELEDDIRDHERRGEFGPNFVALARKVYKTNDERASLKRQVNILSGSEIVEEKSYKEY